MEGIWIADKVWIQELPTLGAVQASCPPLCSFPLRATQRAWLPGAFLGGTPALHRRDAGRVG